MRKARFDKGELCLTFMHALPLFFIELMLCVFVETFVMITYLLRTENILTVAVLV